MYYVYMLRCSDDSLYTGITPDLTRRMRQHAGQIKGGAKYTALRPPKELAAVWTVSDKRAAAKAEYAIKHLPVGEKRKLAAEPMRITELLPQLTETEPTVWAEASLQKLLASDVKNTKRTST